MFPETEGPEAECLLYKGIFKSIEKVVSIDLFWVFFMPFLNNGVYKRPTKLSTLCTHNLSAQNILAF